MCAPHVLKPAGVVHFLSTAARRVSAMAVALGSRARSSAFTLVMRCDELSARAARTSDDDGS